MNIYEFTDYKELLIELLEREKFRGRGQKKQWAQIMNIHPAFFSRVLKDQANLSPEQAIKLTMSLNFDEHQTEYFLLLIQFARSGDHQLNKFLKKRIEDLREDKINLNQVFKDVKEAPKSLDENTYFSRWFYSALHMLLCIPNFRSVDSLSRKLRLPRNLVEESIRFLMEQELVVHGKNGFQVGQKRFHLKKNSPHIIKNMQNWRLKALDEIQIPENLQKNLFYSTVISISEEDAHKIKSILVKSIEKMDSLLQESDEEVVCACNIDFFML